MIKQTLFFLLAVLFFTGCTERGHQLQPTPVQQHIVQSTQYAPEKEKNTQKATTKVVEIETNKVSVDDTTQNTIAGVLVFIIGILAFI